MLKKHLNFFLNIIVYIFYVIALVAAILPVEHPIGNRLENFAITIAGLVMILIFGTIIVSIVYFIKRKKLINFFLILTAIFSLTYAYILLYYVARVATLLG